MRERALEAPVTDGELHELVIRHELQHTETMLQAMRLAGLLPPSFAGPAPCRGTGLEMVEVRRGAVRDRQPARRASPTTTSARATPTSTARFTIGRTPVTNATWLAFVEGGGYARREWWSRRGLGVARASTTSTHHAGAGRDPDAPVVHVTWFEADAFARAHEARLPTEVEWEKAATWGQLEGTGEVWEWTASPFTGYPGFVAHPYREYSEVFFGDRYRVLRGGSCATHPRVASPQFRNWDLPERRQLFAGVRIAR